MAKKQLTAFSMDEAVDQDRPPQVTQMWWSKFWWSRGRVGFCLYAAYGLLALAWPGSYLVWLMQGCRPFLPFVSDFGGGVTRRFFMATGGLGALLQLPLWVDHYVALGPALKEQGRCWTCVRCLALLSGICCSLGTLGVAENPWDRRLKQHMQAAEVGFLSGICLISLMTLLGCRRKERTCWAALMCCASIAGGAGFLKFFGLAIDEVGNHAIQESLHLMGTDYLAYCMGEGTSMHGVFFVNCAAASEWVMLGTLMITSFLLLRRDLMAFPPTILEPPLHHDNLAR